MVWCVYIHTHIHVYACVCACVCCSIYVKFRDQPLGVSCCLLPCWVSGIQLSYSDFGAGACNSEAISLAQASCVIYVVASLGIAKYFKVFIQLVIRISKCMIYVLLSNVLKYFLALKYFYFFCKMWKMLFTAREGNPDQILMSFFKETGTWTLGTGITHRKSCCYVVIGRPELLLTLSLLFFSLSCLR